MDTQKIDHHFFGVNPKDGTDDTPGTFIPAQCSRDHCTSEERAVIDAALAFHKQRRLIADMPLSEALEHGRESYDIVAVFEETCSTLLAERSKQ